MYAGGGKTDEAPPFHYSGTELKEGKHINFLELRAAQYVLLELASPGDVVQLHLDNMTAITLIRRIGATRSPSLC